MSEYQTKATLSQIIKEEVQTHVVQVTENLTRVAALIGFQTKLNNVNSVEEKEIVSDILRAAVVLLHASLEDFIRSLSSKILPYTGEKFLNDIPLYSENGIGGRPEKFLLGKLIEFKDKKVEDVIQMSVNKYLDFSNYNDIKEIASALQRLGVKTENLESVFKKLDSLIKRRHMIVHQADRFTDAGGRRSTREINYAQVKEWLDSVSELVSKALPECGIELLKIKGVIEIDGDNFLLKLDSE